MATYTARQLKNKIQNYSSLFRRVSIRNGDTVVVHVKSGDGGLQPGEPLATYLEFVGQELCKAATGIPRALLPKDPWDSVDYVYAVWYGSEMIDQAYYYFNCPGRDSVLVYKIYIAPEFKNAASGRWESLTDIGTFFAGYDSEAKAVSYVWTSSEATPQYKGLWVTIPIPQNWKQWGQCWFNAKAVGDEGCGEIILESVVGQNGESHHIGAGVTASPDGTWQKVEFSMPLTYYVPGKACMLAFRFVAHDNARVYLGDIAMETT